ncbi:MAG: VWA domain-containing protein [Gemmatimonadota bacterium]
MKRREIAATLRLVDYTLESVAPGYLPGYHIGAFHGTAGKLAGFASLLHRMDPKNIDMVATRRAMSPVPLVRLYQAKVAIDVAVLVDLSASMGFVGRGRKLAEAAKLAACLSHSAYRLGDRFTLTGFGDDVELYFPPKRSADYPWEIGEALWRHRASAKGVGGLDRACALLPRRRSLVLLVSDFHFGGGTVERALAHLQRHDGILAVLWDPAEQRELPRTGWTELYDPETGARTRRWLRRGLVPRFQRTFEARRALLLEKCRRYGSHSLFLHCPFDPAELVRFFLRRRGQARA